MFQFVVKRKAKTMYRILLVALNLVRDAIRKTLTGESMDCELVGDL